MEKLLLRNSDLIRHARHRNQILRVDEFKRMFNDIIFYLDRTSANKRRTDAMYLLTTICDDLASLNTLKIFDNVVLRNHLIFDYIGRTFEMLLTKSNYSSTIPMTKQEEDCLSSMSYFITQLCLYQNEPMGLFYGNVPTEIFPVTEKPNPRDVHAPKPQRQMNDITDKPNLKTARLQPDAPAARPIEKRKPDVRKIQKMKRFHYQSVWKSNEIQVDSSIVKSSETDLYSKTFQDIFLTDVFFNQLIHSIEDLSQYDYSSHHVKYKVTGRLIRLCSKLGVVDRLLSPIIECLVSNRYTAAFQSIEYDQTQLSPQQLFFICNCPQVLIQSGCLEQETLVKELCKKIVNASKSIFKRHCSALAVDIYLSEVGDRRLIMYALSCHLEFIYHFSLTSFGRKRFLQSSIISQFLDILRLEELIDSACEDEHLFHAHTNIVAHICMLLYNLAYESEIFEILKQSDLQVICKELQSANDRTIQFASTTLLRILKEESIDENNEPTKLKDVYIQYLENIIEEVTQVQRTDVTRRERGGDHVKHVFLRGSFLKKLIQDIDHLSKHAYPSNEQRYKDAAQQLRVCSIEKTDVVEELLDPVVACLSSKFYRDVYAILDVNHFKVSKSNLAAKHLFFMRDCVDFLVQHDYKRQAEIANTLCPTILGNATFIFDGYLPNLMENDDNDEKKYARIEAVLYHVKLLNHLTLSQFTRKDFLNNGIIDRIVTLLRNKTLINAAYKTIDIKTVIIGQSLTLLYNLAFTKSLRPVLVNQNIPQMCLQLSPFKDKIIHFTTQCLLVILDIDQLDDIKDPCALTKFCLECMEKSFQEPRRPYQGIKLSGLLRIFEILIGNDLVQKTIVSEKDGIQCLAKCACVNCSDAGAADFIKKVRLGSLGIIWKLLSVEPSISQKLKINDLFIEHLLRLSNETTMKEKKISERLIWKLGDEKTLRLEQAEKQKQSEQDHDDQYSTTSGELSGELLNFNIIMSYCNDSNDKSLSRKIAGRLAIQHRAVHFEDQGKRRFSLIRWAAAKKRIIIICLSNSYRNSQQCMRELEYVSKQVCPVIFLRVGLNFTKKGWIGHLIDKQELIDFSQKNFRETFNKLSDRIKGLSET